MPVLFPYYHTVRRHVVLYIFCNSSMKFCIHPFIHSIHKPSPQPNTHLSTIKQTPSTNLNLLPRP
ncbi:uncharacterized protein BDV14DRAFT_168242 [Aspergillus stella-maris]|uniref:uncharacterized protein n=1 Tax=Aspergillus stella-maris TaxID=1810926 RepID=UPI003CCE4AAB